VNGLAQRNWVAPEASYRVPGPRPCRRPVSRILSWTIIPLGGASPRRSSNLPAGFGLRLPGSLRLGASGRYAHARQESASAIPAYLVLLRVGFTMRRPLLAARCALTAPFHPYLRRFARTGLRRTVRSEAVYFLLHWPSSRLHAAVPDVIRHTALRSPDFPPPPNGEPREAAIVQPPARSIVR
jgi:hypothetical protein